MEHSDSVGRSADKTRPFLPGEDSGTPRAVPTRLGDYLLLREIGRGGMGVVYEAIQESIGRHVALKVLPGNALADPTALDRFRREVRAAGRLHHTNIVPVFGTGECGDVHFYAMQFIEGQGLDGVLQDLRQARPESSPTRTATDQVAPATTDSPPTEPVERHPAERLADLRRNAPEEYHRAVARVGLQAAEALAYAHRQGVLHRDIKPSNLLLDGAGTVWVTDFGLAQSDDAEALTVPGDVVGTLRYLAPERFDGRSLPQGDLYSLGLTLYELLTLRPAFEEPNRARLTEKVLHEVPPSPCQVDPRIPRDLETIVRKAMARDPRDRYGSADSLADDLRRFLSDQPILARPLAWHERTWRWCRRHPAVAALTAVVGFLLLVVAVIASTAAVSLDREHKVVLAHEAELEETNRELEESRASERRAKDDALKKLWLAHFNQARAQRWSGRSGRRFDSLKALAEAAQLEPTLELRNEAIACLALADIRKGRAWEGCPGSPVETTAINFDATFERYARTDARGNISVRRVADDRELMLLPGRGQTAWIILFSPDGRHLAVKYHPPHEIANELLVWDLDERKTVLRLPDGIQSASLAFSADSSTLAVGRPQGGVQLYDLRKRKPGALLAAGVRPERLGFHPSGRRLALSSLAPRLAVQVVDLDPAKPTRTIPLPAGVRGVDWHPGGKLLAAGGSDSRVYLCDPDAGEQRAVLEGHQADVTEVAFSQGGDLLASIGWDGNLLLWDAVAAQPLVKLTECLARGGLTLRFGPGDRQLSYYVAGTKVGLLDVAPGREWRSLRGHTAPKGPYGVSFSPDNTLIVSAADDGVRLWDARTGRELATITGRQCVSAFFHPDGTELFVCTRAALERWPIERRMGERETILRVGPPEPLPSLPSINRMTLSKDGSIAVVVSRAGQGAIVTTRRKAEPAILAPHHAVEWVSISPDGRRIATGTWQGKGVKFWDTRTATAEGSLPGEFLNTRVEFSPDGRWLVTSEQEEFRLWEVGTWKPGPRLRRAEGAPPAGAMAFSADGKVLAIAHSQSIIHLVEAANGNLLAILEAPRPEPISWMAFSPDGRQLAATGNQVVLLWDLARIREQLVEVKLAQRLPTFSSGPRPTTPVRVDVVPR